MVIYFNISFRSQFLVNCGTPPEPSNGIIIPYTSTTEGVEVFFICRSVYHKDSLLEDNYTVSVCSKDGQWEPNPSNFCALTVSGK